jgi:hypothetical protein
MYAIWWTAIKLMNDKTSFRAVGFLDTTSVANNASTLYLTVEEHLSTYVALMMPRVI